MKKFCLLLLIVIITTTAYSQQKINLRGVVLKHVSNEYSLGDTITIYAIKVNPNTTKEQYTIRALGEFRNVNADRIELLDNNFDFWENVWLRNRAQDVTKQGWEVSKRQELQEDALDYFSQARANKMIFHDDLLYDYIYQLVYHIHPTSMLKERASNFSVVILNSTEPMSFAFDNGMLILTAGLIAQTQSEEELISILTQAITHTVLEHNLVNLNYALRAERRARIWGTVATLATATAMAVDQANTGYYHDYTLATDMGLATYFLSSDILENIGAKYSYEQNIKVAQISAEFANSHPYIKTLDEQEYINAIAGTLTYTAWQEYHMKNYHYSKILSERLYDLDLATDRDLLLLSKLQRKLAHDIDSNQQALDYLEMAIAKSMGTFPELEKERALIYTRLNNTTKAKESFLKYKELLLIEKANGVNVENELLYINQMIQRRGFMDKNIAETDTDD